MNNDTELFPIPVNSISRNLTYVVAALMGLLSLAGLLFPESIYQSGTLIEIYMTNDIINLVVGVPILLGTVWFASRGNLAGLLCWPGALLFVVYNYIAYIFGIPFSILSLAYLVIILISSYIIYDLLKKIDKEAVKVRLSGAVVEKLSGWFLLIFGILFILRAGNEFVGSNLNQKILAPPDISVLIADISISLLWIIGGIMLIRRTPLGYSSGLGLLFAASTLFAALVIFLLVQPIFTAAQFNITDLIVVSIMGLFFSIPFVIFLRGTLNTI
jgi:hypothetical protein